MYINRKGKKKHTKHEFKFLEQFNSSANLIFSTNIWQPLYFCRAATILKLAPPTKSKNHFLILSCGAKKKEFHFCNEPASGGWLNDSWSYHLTVQMATFLSPFEPVWFPFRMRRAFVQTVGSRDREKEREGIEDKNGSKRRLKKKSNRFPGSRNRQWNYQREEEGE